MDRDNLKFHNDSVNVAIKAIEKEISYRTLMRDGFPFEMKDLVGMKPIIFVGYGRYSITRMPVDYHTFELIRVGIEYNSNPEEFLKILSERRGFDCEGIVTVPNFSKESEIEVGFGPRLESRFLQTGFVPIFKPTLYRVNNC